MLFNSPIYIFLFLPVVAIAYWTLRGTVSGYACRALLVVASLVFYGYWNPKYLVLIALSIVANFTLGAWIREAGAQQNALRGKILLGAGITANIGALGVFKYADFVIESANALANGSMPLWGLALPLAISFFTFQQIAYLVDCARGEVQERSFLNYCLFVTFFPQLIAGPIVHHKEMMPQFKNLGRSPVNWDSIACGLFVFSIGLVKKTFFADTFSSWVSVGFDSDLALNLVEAWVVAIGYALQLYFDFSGYSDMAIGSALLFNIKLPANFNSPYKASNIQAFWQRWHMTLSRWLKDYLYITLGGSRCSKPRMYANLFLTFLIGGIWHGAGWTYIMWGALHGIAIVAHRIWTQLGLRMHATLGWALTFLFVSVSLIPFRATSLEHVQRICAAMLGANFDFPTLDGSLKNQLVSTIIVLRKTAIPDLNLEFACLFSAVSLLLILTTPNAAQMIGIVPGSSRFSFKPRWPYLLLASLCLSGGLLAMFGNTVSEFLYFEF